MDALFSLRARTPQGRAVGNRTGHRWSHLWGDDLDELHTLAAAIGLKYKWFQDDPLLSHYDVTPSMRARAIRAGAKEMNLRKWMKGKGSKP